MNKKETFFVRCVMAAEKCYNEKDFRKALAVVRLFNKRFYKLDKGSKLRFDYLYKRMMELEYLLYEQFDWSAVFRNIKDPQITDNVKNNLIATMEALDPEIPPSSTEEEKFIDKAKEWLDNDGE